MSDLFETIRQQPEVVAGTRQQRDSYIDRITNSMYENAEPGTPRSQLAAMGEAMTSLKFQLAREKGDLPLGKIPDNNPLSYIGIGGGMAPEDYAKLPEKEQYRLYKSHMASNYWKEVGHWWGDVKEAASLDTLAIGAKAAGMALAGFAAGIPDRLNNLAIDQEMGALAATGALTPELQAQMEAQKAINTKVVDESFERIAGEYVDAYKVARSRNPEGVDFVLNRALDAALAIGTYGVGSLATASARTLGGTALQHGRKLTSLVASFEAQGAAIDWGLNKATKYLEETGMISQLTPGQQVGAHVGLLALSVLATMPAANMLEAAIRGPKPATQVLVDKVKALQKDTDAIRRLATEVDIAVSNEAKVLGRELTSSEQLAAAANSPEVNRVISEAVGQPVDLAAGVRQADELAGRIAAGEEVSPAEAVAADSLFTVKEDATTVPSVTERIRNIKQKTPVNQLQVLDDAVARINELRASQLPEAVEEAVSLEREVAKGILTPKAKSVAELREELVDLVGNDRTLKHAEIARALLEEEGPEALVRVRNAYNAREEEVVRLLQARGVDAKMHQQQRVDKQLYAGAKENWSDEIEALLAEHWQVAYERAPYINGGKSYIDAVSQGKNVQLLKKGNFLDKHLQEVKTGRRTASTQIDEAFGPVKPLTEVGEGPSWMQIDLDRTPEHFTHIMDELELALRRESGEVIPFDSGVRSSKEVLSEIRAITPEYADETLALVRDRARVPMQEKRPEWMARTSVQEAEIAASEVAAQKTVSEVLTPSQARMVEIAESEIKRVWEVEKGSALTIGEQLAAREKAIAQVMNKRLAAERNSFTTTGYYSDTLFSMAKIEQMFPVLKDVLRGMKGQFLRSPDALSEYGKRMLGQGYMTPKAVLEMVSTAWRSVQNNPYRGLFSVQRQALSQDIVKSLDQLWDLARASIAENSRHTKALDKVWLRDVLTNEAKALGLSKKNIDGVMGVIEKLMPDMNLTISFDRSMKSLGRYEALVKEILLNPNKMRPDTLLHELGHHHWVWTLGSAERMAFLEIAEELVSNPTAMRRAFPARAKLLADADTGILEVGSKAADLVSWATEPGEIYADLFARAVTENRLYNESLTMVMSKAQQQMIANIRNSKEDMRFLPKQVRSFFGKLMYGPSSKSLVTWSDEARMAHMKASYFYMDAEEAAARVTAIMEDLEMKYGAIGQSFAELPVAEQVFKLPFEDLKNYSEAKTLQYLHEGPQHAEAAELALGRMQMQLTPAKVHAGIKADIDKTKQGLATYVSDEKDLLDAMTGRAEVDAYRAHVDSPEAIEAARLAETVDNTEVQRKAAFLAQQDELIQYEIAKANLRVAQQVKSGVIRPEKLTEAEKKRLVKRWKQNYIMDDPDSAARLFADRWAKEEERRILSAESQRLAQAKGAPLDATEKFMLLQRFDPTALQEGWWKRYVAELKKQGASKYTIEDMITSGARARVALDVSDLDHLIQLHNHAAAQHGVTSFVGKDVFDRRQLFRQIEEAVETPIWQQSLQDFRVNPIGKVVRYGLGAYFGVTQEDDGSLRFDSDKFTGNMSPLMLYLLPGGRTALRYAMKGGKALGGQMLERLPIDLQDTATKLWDKFSYNLLEYRGLDPLLELSRRAALQEGGIAKQRYSDFASLVVKTHKLDAATRAELGKVLHRTPEGIELLAKWEKEGNELFGLSERIYNAYKEDTERLVRLGVITEQDVPLMMKAYLTPKGRAKTSVISHAEDVKGFKIPFADHKDRGFVIKKEEYRHIGEMFLESVGETVKLRTSGSTIDELMAIAKEEGKAIGNGMQLNAYIEPNTGWVHFAPVGSFKDLEFSGTLKPYMLWDSEKGTRGFYVDKFRANKSGDIPSMVIKRAATETERTLQGESFDAAAMLLNFSNSIERLTAKSEAYAKVAVLGRTRPEYIQKAADLTDQARQALFNKGWKELSTAVDKLGVQKYGPLAGHMVSPEVYKMLRTFEDVAYWKQLKDAMPEPLYKLANGWDQLTKGFKVTHTVLNIPTHLVNFVSNSMQGFMTGRNPIQDLYHGYHMMQARKLEKLYREAVVTHGQGAPQSLKLAQELSEHPYYESLKRARQERIGDSSMVNTELRYDEFAKLIGQEHGMSSEDILGKTMDLIKARGQATFDFARELYEGEDLIYKLGGFHSDLEKSRVARGLKSVTDVPQEDAVKALSGVYDAYFDYSSLPPAVAFMRDAGISPFISYVYKAVPAMLKGIHEHPERLAYLAGGIEALHLMMVANDFGLKNVLQASDALDKMQPEYRNKRMWLGRTTPYLGAKTEADIEGLPRDVTTYGNLGKFMPGVAIAESLNAGEVQSGRNLFENIVAGIWQHPVLSTAYAISAGKDPTFEQNLRDYKGDTDWSKIGGHVMRTMTPNLPVLPWSPAYDSVQQALVNAGARPANEEYTGWTGAGIARPFSSEMVNATLGFRTYRVDVESEATKGIKRELGEIKKAKFEMRSKLTQPGLPESSVEGIVEKFEERTKKPLQQIERRERGQAILESIRAKSRIAGAGQGLPQL